ncbi:MAG: L-glutamate gamma-semialdehyde dehydrogenase [Gemmatimonadota bacterium]|jgi:1-pyrroline-5-carboxylate dehydrogenase|nr:L-glutamate gamma-semialdehyde dehydrogenase [Gemmatimonadota bacterium]
MNGTSNIPAPQNDPIRSYAPGSPERAALKAELKRLSSTVTEIPAIIGGKEIRGKASHPVVAPHKHGHVLATVYEADARMLNSAIAAARRAQREWASWRFEDRAAVLLKAADLLAGRWRQTLNAATMLGQSKTAYQAEIDSACEVVDFWRYNPWFAEQIYSQQPFQTPGAWNRIDHRPLEGFVYAITPFNFTAIGANLPTAPALMGNTVVWKPAGTAALSNYFLMKILEEAGLPPGVINFVPGNSRMITERILADRHLAGIHFTGSTEVFNLLWKGVGANIDNYAAYPRLVGETGGKDFVVAHPTADPDSLSVALVRGAFEYQGQKCSAASRAYIPQSLWPEVKRQMLDMMASIRMGDVADFRNFMGAVIDAKAFNRLKGYLDQARKDRGVTILAGGGADDRKGWFIEPTLIQARNPQYRTMCEELFGPILTVHVYPDKQWRQTLNLVNTTSPYALTGAVLSRDRKAILEADKALRFAAGNYYINDKPTGAIVAQQPFGGGRASGTNDKAGSILNLLRWVSPRTVKETFDPPTEYRYPFMGAE